MIFRLLHMIALIGLVGSDPGPAAEDPEERRMGGEGFGNIVNLVVLIGVLALVVVVALAVLAMTGQFADDLIDPPV